MTYYCMFICIYLFISAFKDYTLIQQRVFLGNNQFYHEAQSNFFWYLQQIPFHSLPSISIFPLSVLLYIRWFWLSESIKYPWNATISAVFPGCLEKSQPFMLPAPIGHRASSHVSQSHSVLSKMLLDGVFFVFFSLCACSWFDGLIPFLCS